MEAAGSAKVDKRTKVQNVKLPINLVRWINLETVERHKPTIQSVVSDMTDAELNEAWQVMGELGVILTGEMGVRNIANDIIGEDVQ